MNKTIWVLAFLVLFSGMTFAAANASVTNISQSGFRQTQVAEYVVTEGGNVSEVDLDMNDTTWKWAGAYGNVSGNIVLGQSSDTSYLYNWTWSESAGEVCVSTNSNPTWGGLAIIGGAAIDALMFFAVADDDSATNTLSDVSVTLDVGGAGALTTTGVDTNGASTWETGILAGIGGSGIDTLISCVNVSTVGTNYKGGSSDYQIMFAANESVGSGPVDNYYFYMELV